MAGISDIAKAAGVSNAVVSRVMNRDSTLRIADETRIRVLKTAEELDYAPNSAASSLRSAQSGLIAMVVHDVTNPIYSEILRGAQHKATSLGQAILISEASALDDRASKLPLLIGGGGVDGLILQSDGGISDLVLARAAKKNVPTILLQAELDSEATFNSFPDKEAAEIATRHLIELGHSKIGCLATHKGLTFTQDRIAGWTSTMLEASLSIDDSRLEFADPVIYEGREMTKRLLLANPDLTGLVCCNTISAIGALEAALQIGLDVPESLSIVSIHEIELAHHIRVPLTTVKMPLFEMGSCAIEVLGRNQNNSIRRVKVTERPKLIKRSSTSAL